MHGRTLAIVGAITVGMCSVSVPVHAEGGAVELGANAGVAVPLKHYRHTVSGVGGTAGFSAGYRFFLTDYVALSLLGNPQVSIFGTEDDCCPGPGDDDDIGVVMSGTAGPKLTLGSDPVAFYVQGQGGYYWDLTRPIKDDGPGYNVGAGLDFHIDRSNKLGVFGRYDVAYMTPEPESGHTQRKWVSGGLAFTHLFMPDERIEPAPLPPPAPPPAARPAPAYVPPPATERRGG